MFRGVRPISGNYAVSMRCRQRATGLGSGASPLQIFYNLGMGRVHFDAAPSLLYFVESPDLPVPDIIASVLRHAAAAPVYEQMYLDQHKLLKGALMLRLLPEQVAAVLAALRLSGIDISIAGERPQAAVVPQP